MGGALTSPPLQVERPCSTTHAERACWGTVIVHRSSILVIASARDSCCIAARRSSVSTAMRFWMTFSFLVRHLIHHPSIAMYLHAQAFVPLVDECVVFPVAPWVP